MATVLETRKALVDRGYTPITVNGKIPPFKLWQKVENVTPAMLDGWSRNWPAASNTGILTKHTPTLDIDVLNEDAAIAVEDMVRERFEERGYILPRIGKAPKRAVIFRTLDPFVKITVNLIAANGSTGVCEKIEFLCDGQQVVVSGIHPDTQREYAWPRGNPTDIARDDLPDVNEVEAQQLVADIVELLCRDFGYSRASFARARKSNGAAQADDPADHWQKLVNDILAGNDLHANTRDLAAKMVRAGTDGGAVVNFLRGLLSASTAPHDERWQRRYDDLPRLVYSFEDKLEREREQAAAAAAASAAATSAAATSTALVVIKSPPSPPPPPPSNTGPASAAPGPTCAVEETLKVFDKWLLLKDHTPVLATLGAVSANYLDGDACWFGLIGPPSSAKTEILNSASQLPHVVRAGTLTQAALLSGVPRRQHGQGAHGGLLRQIGSFGIICLKDFGSVLSMHPDAKAELLGALREVFDGSWTRNVGSDGGRTLSWEGKVGLVFAATGVYDAHYAVIGKLGDRFILSRLEPVNQGQLDAALRHRGAATAVMRKELREAVGRLFAGRAATPREISQEEISRLDLTIRLVVRLRAPVERDRGTKAIEALYGAEGAARIGLTLERLLGGLDVLGVDRETSLKVVETVALDSAPPLRRKAYEIVCAQANISTKQVAVKIALPTVTVRRVLEDLAAYRLVTRSSQGAGKADLWSKNNWEAEP